MLTPGISVKAITFRRDGFRKLENMNRKKTKNLLVIMVLSSAAVAGYLVFYKHEMGSTRAAGGHHKSGSGRHSALEQRLQSRIKSYKSRISSAKGAHDDELNIKNKDGDVIGQKLFMNGVDRHAWQKEGRAKPVGGFEDQDEKVMDLQARLNARLKEQKEEEEESVADDEEEANEDEYADENGADEDAGDDKEKEDEYEDNAADEEEEESAGGEEEEAADEEEEEEEEGAADDNGADNEEEETDTGGDEFGGGAMDLRARLNARLRDRKKVAEKEVEDAAEEDEEAVEEASEEEVEEEEVAVISTPNRSSGVRSWGEDDQSEVAEVGDDDGVVDLENNAGDVEDDDSHAADNFGLGKLKPIQDIVYEKKYGVKRPVEDDEDADVIQPFDERSFNRDSKEKVAEKQVEDRIRQHILSVDKHDADLLPKEGLDAFQPKKYDAFGMPNSFKKGFEDPFKAEKKEIEPHDNINDPFSWKKEKKENPFGAFGLPDEEDKMELPKEEGKKKPAYQLNKPGAHEFEEEDDGGGLVENKYINSKGLVKSGGMKGLRPFGNKGVNPFLGGEAIPKEGKKEKHSWADIKGEGKVHIDLRDLDKKNINKGLLLEDDEMEMPGMPPNLPPADKEMPDKADGFQAGFPNLPQQKFGVPNQFGEIPVPPPKKFGVPNQFGEIPVPPPKKFGVPNQFGEIPVPPPNKFGVPNQFGEIPVPPPAKPVLGGVAAGSAEAPLAAAADAASSSSSSSSSSLNIRNVNRKIKTNAACIKYEFPSTVGTGSVCTHKKGLDLVSDTIAKDGVWEPIMMDQLVAILNSDWTMKLIDIGAGIGMFSICAALMHRDVIAVEPYSGNYLALHQSAYNNVVGAKITLVTQALDNTSYVGQIALASKSDGGYSNLHINKVLPGMDVETKRKVNVTTLDKLVPLAESLNFGKTLLKIDVTDQKEANILNGGREFFEKVDVHYILTHWKKSIAEADHMVLMTTMAQLRFAPHRTWDGPTLQMEHLMTDQSFLVWVKIH